MGENGGEGSRADKFDGVDNESQKDDAEYAKNCERRVNDPLDPVHRLLFGFGISNTAHQFPPRTEIFSNIKDTGSNGDQPDDQGQNTDIPQKKESVEPGGHKEEIKPPGRCNKGTDQKPDFLLILQCQNQ